MIPLSRPQFKKIYRRDKMYTAIAQEQFSKTKYGSRKRNLFLYVIHNNNIVKTTRGTEAFLFFLLLVNRYKGKWTAKYFSQDDTHISVVIYDNLPSHALSTIEEEINSINITPQQISSKLGKNWLDTLACEGSDTVIKKLNLQKKEAYLW